MTLTHLSISNSRPLVGAMSSIQPYRWRWLRSNGSLTTATCWQANKTQHWGGNSVLKAGDGKVLKQRRTYAATFKVERCTYMPLFSQQSLSMLRNILLLTTCCRNIEISTLRLLLLKPNKTGWVLARKQHIASEEPPGLFGYVKCSLLQNPLLELVVSNFISARLIGGKLGYIRNFKLDKWNSIKKLLLFPRKWRILFYVFKG